MGLRLGFGLGLGLRLTRAASWAQGAGHWARGRRPARESSRVAGLRRACGLRLRLLGRHAASGNVAAVGAGAHSTEPLSARFPGRKGWKGGARG